MSKYILKDYDTEVNIGETYWLVDPAKLSKKSREILKCTRGHKPRNAFVFKIRSKVYVEEENK